ncbi:MAG: hypothetical protein FWF05_07950 [Oscillospiraceae bacterium]|nr:hypothetical protein [Oscillospiraceae bacterium]
MYNDLDFYLAANTAKGFYSLFDELYDPFGGWRAYILKGGPGTGKSSMMKAIAAACAKEGLVPERIWCSSDPQSLDALIFHDVKICVADGTPPHTVEPKFPGAVETLVNLGGFWDAEKLFQRRKSIIGLTAECASLHKRCARFLLAAESLDRDVKRIAAACVDLEKLARYASRLAGRKFGAPRGRVGTESRRFLGAVTPKGTDFFEDTVTRLCTDVMIAEDEYGAVSSLLLSDLRRYALGNGLDVISCPCVLDPDGPPEHLFVPETGFGIVTCKSFHRFDFPGAQKVRYARFTDTAGLRERKCRVNFSLRTEKELLEEAVVSMRNALELHDKLEELYVDAMDFTKVEEAGRRIAAEIVASCG